MELTKDEEFAAFDRLKAQEFLRRARAVMFLGNLGRQIDFKAALQVFEEECSLPDIARTLLGLGGVYADGKQVETGLARALWAVALFEELGDTRGLMDACHRAGQSFGSYFLTREALDMQAKAISIGERIGDFNRMAEASASASWSYESAGDLSAALSRSLKALEYCDKTDSDWIRGITYSNIVRQYAKLGDSKRAEEYFEKLKNLPLEVLSSPLFVRFALSKAVFYASKNEWDEANQSMGDAFHGVQKEAQPCRRSTNFNGLRVGSGQTKTRRGSKNPS